MELVYKTTFMLIGVVWAIIPARATVIIMIIDKEVNFGIVRSLSSVSESRKSELSLVLWRWSTAYNLCRIRKPGWLVWECIADCFLVYLLPVFSGADRQCSKSPLFKKMKEYWHCRWWHCTVISMLNINDNFCLTQTIYVLMLHNEMCDDTTATVL